MYNISELVAQLRRENIELRTKLDKTEETLEVCHVLDLPQVDHISQVTKGEIERQIRKGKQFQPSWVRVNKFGQSNVYY